MGMIAELSAVILPVFFCAATGFVWARLKYPFNNQIMLLPVWATSSRMLSTVWPKQ